MRWWAAVAVLCVGVAVTVATPDTAVGHAAYLVCFTGMVVVLWRAVRRGGPAGRLSWLLVAAAMTSWLAGDLLGYALELAGWQITVGPSDVLWLGGYPLLGAALVIMVRRRAPGQSRAAALDGLTLTTAAALCIWQLVVAPAVADQHVTVAIVVSTLYPLGDVILLAAVLYLVLSPGRRGAPTRLLVSGMGLTLLGDLAFAVVPTYWPSIDVSGLDGLLLLANALMSTAILHPGREELLTPVYGDAESLHPARVLFLGLALLTAPMMAISRGGLSMNDRVLLVVGTVVAVGLSLARFVGAVREQTRVQGLLAERAARDELTGLANRRALIEQLELDYQPRPDTVLLYLDLDGFKAINDEHGHAAGDAVLIEVAHRLRQAVRAGDLVARLGGDEFAVLCHRLELAEGHHLAGRLVAAICHPIRYADDLMLSVSASIGVASAQHSPTGDALIAKADHAMFEVKRSSRPGALEPHGRPALSPPAGWPTARPRRAESL